MLHHAVLLVLILRADDAPGALTWPEVHYESGETECADALPDGTRTLLGVRLEMATLASFERVLGPSPLRKQGDGGEYFAWRCWEAENGDGTVLVVGRGEVHAEFQVLGRDMMFPQRGTCPKSKLVDRSLATANGIRLGMTQAQVEQRTGPASKSGTGWSERACLSKQPMNHQEKARVGGDAADSFDISSTIRLVERDGRTEAFRVMWTVTY
jgi:hypothetical protein